MMVVADFAGRATRGAATTMGGQLAWGFHAK